MFRSSGVQVLGVVAAVLACSCAYAQAPLTESEAVQIALRGNPTLEAARHERNVAQIQADRTKPAFRPEVNATASQIFRTPRYDLPGRPDAVVLPESVSRLEVSVRQPIYQFGAGSAPGQRYTATRAAAGEDYRKAELDTTLQAREAYLNLQRAEAMAVVARRGVELAAENVRVTGLLKERGLQADVDVLEAERAKAEADTRRLQADNGIASARGNLNRVLGRSVDTAISLPPAGDLPAAPASLEELVGEAKRQRPEVLSLKENIAAAEAGVKLARASNLPRINLEAGFVTQTKTAIEPDAGVYGGVSITAPLFNGAAGKSLRREAEERVAQAKAGLAALEGGIALEVQQQRLAMEEARARIGLSEKARDAAEKAYEIVMAKLELGRAVQLEVLNARLNLERALSDRAAAENDVRLAKARLDRAIGR